MSIRRFIATLCLLIPGVAQAESCGRVKEVISAKSFVMESGETVRLAAIQAPNIADDTRPGEPLGPESKAALARLVEGKDVCLGGVRRGAPDTDRHGRLVAVATLATGERVQDLMLRQGWAMVYSFPDSRRLAGPMLAIESEARGADRGIWAHPYYRIRNAEDVADAEGKFALVQGKVAAVATTRTGTYINFGMNWKTDFTLFISGRDLRRFKALNPETLKGTPVRVRGWVYAKNGPAIDLTHPEQIEILK